MKTKILTIRAPENLYRFVEEEAKKVSGDRSTVARMLLIKGAKSLMLEKAISAYEADKVSIGKAAEMAQISIYEMLAILRKRGIELKYDYSDYIEDLRNAEHAIKEMHS